MTWILQLILGIGIAAVIVFFATLFLKTIIENN